MTESTKRSNKAIDATNLRVEALRKKFDQLRSDVNKIKDILNTKDNWNSQVREWIGTKVRCQDFNGYMHDGVLMWIDKYSLCIKRPGSPPKPRVLGKGAISWIEQD